MAARFKNLVKKATRFLKILSNGNKFFKNLVKWQKDFLKISSNGNKILKSKLMKAPSYMIIFNFSFPISIGKKYVASNGLQTINI